MWGHGERAKFRQLLVEARCLIPWKACLLAEEEIVEAVRKPYRICKYLFTLGGIWILAGGVISLFARELGIIVGLVGLRIFTGASAVTLAICRCPACDQYLSRLDRTKKVHCGARVPKRLTRWGRDFIANAAFTSTCNALGSNLSNADSTDNWIRGPCRVSTTNLRQSRDPNSSERTNGRQRLTGNHLSIKICSAAARTV